MGTVNIQMLPEPSCHQVTLAEMSPLWSKMSICVEQPGSHSSLPLTSYGNSGKSPNLSLTFLICNMGIVVSPGSSIQWMFSSASNWWDA